MQKLSTNSPIMNSSHKHKQMCVVITRPQKQAQIWADKLRHYAIDSFSLPLLEIVSFHKGNSEDEQWLRPIKNCMLNLDLYHKIIFVSQNAVDHGMQWVDRYWPQIPVGIDFFAIGETTASFLREYGVTVKNLAASHETDMTSEALLTHDDLQSVADEKILIVRGVGGRGHLAEILKERGAKVDYCEVYQRRIPPDAQTQINSWLENHLFWQENEVVLAFHSNETWNYFCEILQKIQAAGSSDLMSRLTSLPVLIPSVRVEQQVNKSGFHRTILAKNATDEAMTQAINHYIRSKPE